MVYDFFPEDKNVQSTTVRSETGDAWDHSYDNMDGLIPPARYNQAYTSVLYPPSKKPIYQI